jgi:asparagine synthase (glutamine-hydrolysing)
MCGIYGIYYRDHREIPVDLLAQLGTAIRHRGPDHTGSYCEPGLALGMNRLAIIDVAGGNQPMFNEDGSLVIVYNGEIYNHLEIRSRLTNKGHVFGSRCDTETVLHAFEEYGPECVHQFNGMFALAVWNKQTRSLFLARDRLGIKPLYFTFLKEGLAFASEAKALLPLFPEGAKPDWTAISRFFSFGYVPCPDSPFLGIQKMPSGTYGFVDHQGIKTQRYWQPSIGMGDLSPIPEAQARVFQLLDEAVQKELMSDVPLGVFLSGGLDSSAVALFAQKNSIAPVHTFNLRFNEKTHDESSEATLVAKHLGLEHHEFLFDAPQLITALANVANLLDEPFGDSTVLPLYILSSYARSYVTVVLTGWGGDELFAGYPTYKAHQLARLYRRLPSFLSHTLIPAVVNRLPVSDKYMSFEFKAKRFIKGLGLPPELQHFAWMGYFDEPGKNHLFTHEVLSQVKSETFAPVRRVIEKLVETDIVSRIQHLDALFFLEGNGLFQADRMTMATSLEARVPLLNIDLLTYVYTLPAHLKMQGGEIKGLLRHTLDSHLPTAIINKPKKGFGPPSAAWIRGPLAGIVTRLFSRQRLEEQGIFCWPEINRLLEEHFNRKADHGRNLWALLSFQLWYERFILNHDPATLIYP